jgi:hypothetical protein
VTLDFQWRGWDCEGVGSGFLTGSDFPGEKNAAFSPDFPKEKPTMIIKIAHIDQVYVLQESLEGSRSKTARAVLSQIEARRSSWPKTNRWLTRAAFSVVVDDGKTVVRSLQRFIAKCDPVRHWRAVDAAVALCRS